jgi:anthranilate phosphoribosyltransferase
MPLLSYLHSVAARQSLSAREACAAMRILLGGEAPPSQIAALLVALRMKGETAEELAGFAEAMRACVARVEVDLNGEPLLDTCGTGGDGSGTFNISTTAAFVAAGAGVRVAKHGNRSISSRCGSADVLEAMGIRVGEPPERVAAAIRDVGIGFLFAPALHPAMKYAQPVRMELKMRTVFNLLGPLTNPAGATVQVVGAPSLGEAELMAGALAALGARRALVVHGADGLDEITTTGATAVFDVCGGMVRRTEVIPADFGLPSARLDELSGGDKETNCRIAVEILAGARGPRRDVVIANAAAALVAAGAGAAMDWREGAQRAAEAIDSGAARAKAEALRRFSMQAPRLARDS